MSVDEVERQFREVNAYNLFYSSLTPRASPSLYEKGWRLPMMFYEIDDTYSGIHAEPDFVLYDGDTCLLVEIKSGNNIEQDYIDQLERYNSISIDGMIEELEAAEVPERTQYDGDVRHIESCIVYQDMDEEWVKECRTAENCREMLEGMESESPILAQDYGGELRTIAGDFDSGRLDALFSSGVELPVNPKEEIMLTEQMEKEVLAVAICDSWGEQAIDHGDPVECNVSEVRDYFAPRFNIPPKKANRVLYYLSEIGACNHVEDLTYEFTRSHLSEILSIKQTVRDSRVEEVLDDVDEEHIPDERQGTLTMDYDEDGEESVANDEDTQTTGDS